MSAVLVRICWNPQELKNTWATGEASAQQLVLYNKSFIPLQAGFFLIIVIHIVIKKPVNKSISNVCRLGLSVCMYLGIALCHQSRRLSTTRLARAYANHLWLLAGSWCNVYYIMQHYTSCPIVVEKYINRLRMFKVLLCFLYFSAVTVKAFSCKWRKFLSFSTRLWNLRYNTGTSYKFDTTYEGLKIFIHEQTTALQCHCWLGIVLRLLVTYQN